jgi:hypothetical protein
MAPKTKAARAALARKQAHADRQRENVQARRDAGYVRMTITVPPRHHEEVQALFAKLRRKWAKIAAAQQKES